MLPPCQEASCKAPEFGDVLMGIGESFVRMIAHILLLFDLASLIAEVGRRERHPSLEVLYQGAVWTHVQPCSVCEPPGASRAA